MFAAMTFAEATKYITEELKTIYSDCEANNIADLGDRTYNRHEKN
jgi:hypothetical protein